MHSKNSLKGHGFRIRFQACGSMRKHVVKKKTYQESSRHPLQVQHRHGSIQASAKRSKPARLQVPYIYHYHISIYHISIYYHIYIRAWMCIDMIRYVCVMFQSYPLHGVPENQTFSAPEAHKSEGFKKKHLHSQIRSQQSAMNCRQRTCTFLI